MEVVSKEIMYEIFSWWISFLVAIQTLNKLVSTLKVPGNIRTFLGMNWMNMNFPQHTLSRKHKGGLPQLLKTKNSPTCDSDTLPLEYAKRMSNCHKIEQNPKTWKIYIIILLLLMCSKSRHLIGRKGCKLEGACGNKVDSFLTLTNLLWH